jgi:hypothetical protein
MRCNRATLREMSAAAVMVMLLTIITPLALRRLRRLQHYPPCTRHAPRPRRLAGNQSRRSGAHAPTRPRRLLRDHEGHMMGP